MARPDPAVDMPAFVQEALAHCFGCGPLNPAGLQLAARQEGPLTVVEFQGHRAHAGWDTVYHGGIVATIVDEVAAFAMMRGARAFGMTRRLSVEYLRRVHWTKPLRAEAQVAERDAARALVRCRILQEGQLCTQGEVEFRFMDKPPPSGR